MPEFFFDYEKEKKLSVMCTTLSSRVLYIGNMIRLSLRMTAILMRQCLIGAVDKSNLENI